MVVRGGGHRDRAAFYPDDGHSRYAEQRLIGGYSRLRAESRVGLDRNVYLRRCSALVPPVWYAPQPAADRAARSIAEGGSVSRGVPMRREQALRDRMRKPE